MGLVHSDSALTHTLRVVRKAAPLALKVIALGSSLLMASHASAYTCRYRSSAPAGLAGTTIQGSSNATIPVPVQDTAETGQVNIIDLSAYIECKNDNPGTYTDHMDMQRASTVLSNNFDVRVKANGVEYTVPFSGSATVLHLPKGGSGSYAPIPLQIYYYMKEIPGERVAIKKGQVIGSIQAHKYSIPAGGAPTFTWTFTAANDTIVTSGGCAINDGNQIEINFGVMNQQQLSSTEDRRQVTSYIPYKCRITSVNMGIKLSLVADQPTFSSDLVQTSNSAIGIKVMRGSDQLKPYSNTLHSTITQGVGGDNFTFSLLKQSGSTPAAGTFTGSATLIMSAD